MKIWNEFFRDISIHALREEGDNYNSAEALANRISIHALREEGDFEVGVQILAKFISIHALREEGDFHGLLRGGGDAVISIHALREEGDIAFAVFHLIQKNFYPRPPRGGRPAQVFRHLYSFINFYPRPPRGGRRQLLPATQGRNMISIHALREEGDAKQAQCQLHRSIFLSTPSARRATSMWSVCRYRWRNFYPRPPRGGRRSSVLHFAGRRAISIHALREEGDLLS